MKTVAQKMGVPEKSRTYFKHVPAGVIEALKLPEVNLSPTLTGEFDYMHLFVKSQSEFQDIFPKLKSHLNLSGMLWVSWPKGGKLDTDLSLPRVIILGYTFGLVESTCLSINETWSALKFTHPKKGKIYNNSFGKLNARTTNR